MDPSFRERYVIERELGHGGMATVYLARDTRHDRQVAVKAPLAAPDYDGHPLALALDRLAAARWLLASGNPEEAVRLLRWVDGAFFLSPTTTYSLMFTGLADLERGRVEEKLGHAALAARYYRRFLRRYDRPMQRHAPLVKEAKERIVYVQ